MYLKTPNCWYEVTGIRWQTSSERPLISTALFQTLSEIRLRKVATPFVDESQERQGCLEPANPADDKEVGKLATTACSILMTNMFGARASRWDLLRPTAGLATFIHKWTPNSDKRLHRLMQYVNCRLDDSAVGFVGDPPSEWYLALFADADFAGCRTTMKSTGGVFLVLMGPNTFMPLTASSKKHGSASASSTEAEVVTLAIALRTIGIPALDLLEELLGRKVELVIFEDNQATKTIVSTGKYAKAMGHVPRCHGVQLTTVTERLRDGTCTIEDCHTESMAADIFTKHFTDQRKWLRAITLIGIIPPESAAKAASG